MKEKDFKRVCITASVYNLFLYLLISSEEEYRNTFFFIGKGIPETIRKNIENHKYMPLLSLTKHEKKWAIIKCNFLSRFYYPFLNKATIYAQDHLPVTPYIIANRDYTFIEDGPNIFSITQPTEMWRSNMRYLSERSLFQKVKDNFISKAISGIMANNVLCKEVIVTTPDYVSYLDGKKFTQIDISQLWKEASDGKKLNIMRVFNICNEDIIKLRKRSKILFTQPFVVDGELTEEEHYKIYRDILSRYNMDDVIIKTHPRDNFDYQKYFFNCLIFDKPVPFQLLSLFDVKYDTAITVCSTSVSMIPYDLKIDWVGASVHPNILKSFGDVIPKEVVRKRIV